MSEHVRRTSDSSVFEVEFTIEDTAYPFVGASESEGCRFALAEMTPRRNGKYAEFFTVSGADPERILELAGSHDTAEVSLLREHEDGGLFEFLVDGGCPAFSLAELGALPREILSVNGTGRIVAEIPPQRDASAVVEAFLDEIPGAELASKREKDSITPLLRESRFQELLHTRLTDRQREVLQAAYEAGYYEWPRGCTGTDIAETLGITSATFSEHIHAAERKLISVLFDGPH